MVSYCMLVLVWWLVTMFNYEIFTLRVFRSNLIESHITCYGAEDMFGSGAWFTVFILLSGGWGSYTLIYTYMDDTY